MEFVEKFSILCFGRELTELLAFAPTVACTVPADRNSEQRPLTACDSGFNGIVSSACGIVGAAAIWCVVGSIVRK